MKKLLQLTMSSAFISVMFVCSYAFAQDVIAPQDFLAQVLQAIQGFGGLATMAKISSVILIIIASMKVTVLNQWIWSKLGPAQAWVAPLLGLIAGVLGIGSGGQAVTLASVMAYVAAGGGAVVLHELLDSIKEIPGIGAAYVAAISFVEGLIPGSAAPK